MITACEVVFGLVQPTRVPSDLQIGKAISYGLENWTQNLSIVQPGWIRVLMGPAEVLAQVRFESQAIYVMDTITTQGFHPGPVARSLDLKVSLCGSMSVSALSISSMYPWTEAPTYPRTGHARTPEIQRCPLTACSTFLNASHMPFLVPCLRKRMGSVL